MKKPRISTQEIAEIIIENFEEMKGYTERIEKATDKTLEIDTREFENLMIKQTKKEEDLLRQRKQFIRELNAVTEKNQLRAPNWMLYVLVAVCCTLFVTIFYLFTLIHGSAS